MGMDHDHHRGIAPPPKALKCLKDYEAREREATLGSARWDAEMEWSLEIGLPGSDSIDDKTISTFPCTELPHFANINAFMSFPYLEDVREVAGSSTQIPRGSRRGVESGTRSAYKGRGESGIQKTQGPGWNPRPTKSTPRSTVNSWTSSERKSPPEKVVNQKGSHMNREEATELILEAKREKGLTFEMIANKVGKHKIWTTAALYGQHPMSEDEAETVVDLLGLDPEVAGVLQEFPMRGSLETDVPTDPTIYRIHEITQVYGTTIKALIHEEFGDGIMSAINFNMNIERVENPEGDRVRITYEGKFLPYQW